MVFPVGSGFIPEVFLDRQEPRVEHFQEYSNDGFVRHGISRMLKMSRGMGPQRGVWPDSETGGGSNNCQPTVKRELRREQQLSANSETGIARGAGAGLSHPTVKRGLRTGGENIDQQ